MHNIEANTRFICFDRMPRLSDELEARRNYPFSLLLAEATLKMTG